MAERLLRARLSAAKLCLEEVDGETRRQVSNIQVDAVLELCKRNQGFAGMSDDARASLLDVACSAKWEADDLRKIIGALRKPDAPAAAPKARREMQRWAPAFISYFTVDEWHMLQDPKVAQGDKWDITLQRIIQLGGRTLSEGTFKGIASFLLLLSNQHARNLPTATKASVLSKVKEHFRNRLRRKGAPAQEHHIVELPPSPAALKATYPDLYGKVFAHEPPTEPIASFSLIEWAAVDASYGCRGSGDVPVPLLRGDGVNMGDLGGRGFQGAVAEAVQASLVPLLTQFMALATQNLNAAVPPTASGQVGNLRSLHALSSSPVAPAIAAPQPGPARPVAPLKLMLGDAGGAATPPANTGDSQDSADSPFARTVADGTPPKAPEVLDEEKPAGSLAAKIIDDYLGMEVTLRRAGHKKEASAPYAPTIATRASSSSSSTIPFAGESKAASPLVVAAPATQPQGFAEPAAPPVATLAVKADDVPDALLAARSRSTSSTPFGVESKVAPPLVVAAPATQQQELAEPASPPAVTNVVKVVATDALPAAETIASKAAAKRAAPKSTKRKAPSTDTQQGEKYIRRDSQVARKKPSVCDESTRNHFLVRSGALGHKSVFFKYDKTDGSKLRAEAQAQKQLSEWLIELAALPHA